MPRLHSKNAATRNLATFFAARVRLRPDLGRNGRISSAPGHAGV